MEKVDLFRRLVKGALLPQMVVLANVCALIVETLVITLTYTFDL